MALKELKDQMAADGKNVEFTEEATEETEDKPQEGTKTPVNKEESVKDTDTGSQTNKEEDKTETSEDKTKTETKTKKEESEVDNQLLESFNEKFSTKYESEDDIKKVLSKSDDVSSLKEKIDNLESQNKFLENELESKHEASNPEKIYGSIDAYKEKLIRDKGSEKGYNRNVVERLLKADIDQISPLQLVMMDLENQAEELTGEKATLITLALKKVGLDVDGEIRRHEESRARKKEEDDIDIGPFSYEKLKLTDAQNGELKILASDIRKKFKELKSVQPEEFKGYQDYKKQKLGDIEKQRKEVLDSWGDRINDITKDFKIEFSYQDTNGENDSYEFIDNAFNEIINESVKDYITSENIKPTDENIKKIRSSFVNKFWGSKEKRELALKKIIEDAKMRTEEKITDKFENPKPINKEESPDKKDEDTDVGKWIKNRSTQTNLESIF